MTKRIILIFLTIVSLSTSLFAKTKKQKIDNIITEIQSNYNVKLFYDTIPASTWQTYITYEKITESDYNQFYDFLKLFKTELYKYPVKFIDTTNLKYVSFVKEFALSGQKRTALPDYVKEMLIYDIYRGCEYKTYVRHIIHHEFYHMIEEQFHKTAYYKDSVWATFNNKEIKYGDGGASVQDKGNVYLFTHPLQGFINLYALSAIEEDKAELYASLFIRKEKRKVKRWSRHDEILENKVLYMKKFLASLCSDKKKRIWKKAIT
ncbi:MAG: hypothetical protein A2491_14200 [Bacteroidetes bacterium RIFOXYC12_FULL_35_7]|nr:MAG: hypothetical protein A2491_14200 [Bacteroidetes bacterium RIFOXYC12_FULL_35_7]